MNDIDKRKELSHVKDGIELYKYGYITRKGALAIYRVWVDDDDNFHPLHFISKDGLLNLLSYDVLEDPYDRPTTDQVTDCDTQYKLITDLMERHDITLNDVNIEHYYLSKWQSFNEPQNDDDYYYDNDDGPDMQEWFDHFDHDRDEMSNRFGDDWERLL